MARARCRTVSSGHGYCSGKRLGFQQPGRLVIHHWTTRSSDARHSLGSRLQSVRPPCACSNPNMTYHGGLIMKSTVSEAIFWGPSWANSSFVGDKMTGLDSWYSGFSNSNYAKTSDEYTGSNGQVGPVVTHNGHLVDLSTASNGSSTSAIVSEVCKEIANPVSNGYYPVYV